MGKPAAVISIDIKANTGTLNGGLDEAKRKFGELGAHGVSNMQATSAALRVLEGNVTSNIRAAERFLGSIKGVGSTLQAAFPLVGSVALVGVLSEMIEKATKLKEAYDQLKDAPHRIADGYQKISDSLETTNARMRVQSDTLQKTIDTLRGKPHNGLKDVLDEAIASSMELSASINKTFDELAAKQADLSVGYFGGLVSGQKNTTDLNAQDKQFQDQHALDARQYATDLRHIDRNASEDEQAKQRKAAVDKLIAADEKLAKAENQSAQRAEEALKNSTPDTYSTIVWQGGRWVNTQAKGRADSDGAQQSVINARYDSSNALLDEIKLFRQTQSQKSTAANLKDNQYTYYTDPYAEKLQEFQRELEAARAKANNAGNAIGEALARGAEKGQKAIDELTHKLAEEGKTLTNSQRLTLSLSAQSASLAELDAQLKTQAAARSAQDQKKSSEEAMKAIEAQFQEEDRLAKLGEEREKAQVGRITKLRGELKAIEYESEAVHGGRNAQFQAQIAGIRAKGREAGTPADEIAEEIQLAQAKHDLEDRKNGIGESASDGFKDFFHQFQENVQSSGQMVKTSLGGAFEGVNQQLANLVSGQKTSWSSFFRSISAEFAQFALQIAESSLMKQLAGGLLGSVGGGVGGFFSNLFGGFKASGGDVDPGHGYVVGEKGPEYFSPGTSGTIIPNHALKGGGPQITYMIDARGTDAEAVNQRVGRALVAVHGSAVQQAVKANREMALRRPRGA